MDRNSPTVESCAVDQQAKRKRWWLWVLLAGLAAVLVIRVAPLRGTAGSLVTVRIEDGETGEAIPDAVAHDVRRWTELPIGKLHIKGITPWRSREVPNVGGHVTALLPAGPQGNSARLYVEHPKYLPATVIVAEGGFQVWRPGHHGSVFIPRTNKVTLALERIPREEKMNSIPKWRE